MSSLPEKAFYYIAVITEFDKAVVIFRLFLSGGLEPMGVVVTLKVFCSFSYRGYHYPIWLMGVPFQSRFITALYASWADILHFLTVENVVAVVMGITSQKDSQP